MAPSALSLRNSISLSLLLHAGVLALCLVISARSNTVDLPVGVELMFGTESAGPSLAKSTSSLKSAARTVVADHSDIVDNQKNESRPEPQAGITGATIGNPQGTSDQGALAGPEGVQNGREVSPEERYLYEVRKLLERNKRYPVMARKMGQTGLVLVKFTLAKDGSLLESEVVQKAPFESLNEAAHNLVKSLHGAKPFPEEIHKATVSVTVPIDYSIN